MSTDKLAQTISNDLAIQDAFSEFLMNPNEETKLKAIVSVVEAKAFLDSRQEEETTSGLPYRHDCRCPCHTSEGMITHCVPCCTPTPFGL